MARRYDAVFLDLGGVVLDLASVDRARELFIDRLGERYEFAVADPNQTWKRVLGDYFREREGSVFRPAREGYERAVAELLADEVEDTAWWPLFVETAAEAFSPVDGAPETVRALDDAGYYVNLISDIDAWEAEYILRLFDLRDCFDHVTTSEEVGATKPAADIFEAAIEKAGVDPESSLYVGDRYTHDMVGGKRAGFRTVAFGGDAVDEAPTPDAGFAVDDPSVDFVIDDIRDLLSVAGVDAP